MPTQSQVFNQIVSGYRSLNAELSKLEPSTPINFYEIDLTEIYPKANYATGNQPITNGILRVYNDYNLFNISTNQYGVINWQGNFYYPFPIYGEGFDLSSSSTLPTPTLSFSNFSPDLSNNSFYKYIRMQIESLGDIVGCKFTRIRSFLKYLNSSNFSNGINPYTDDTSIVEIELPRDIYYIDRKNIETRSKLEFTLASILDVENVNLPGRMILGSRCPFQYRGEGCLYEYNTRKTNIHSGIYGQVTNPGVRIHLPLEAPPVATDNDELYLGTIFTGLADQLRFSGISYRSVGAGNYGNLNQWSFTNYTLGGAGTDLAAATILNDGSTVVVGATSQASIGTVQLILNTGVEITRIRIASRTTFTNNYQVQYSPDAGIWQTVRNISGEDLTWALNGNVSGTYLLDFPSRGNHTGWRIITTNSSAGTQISELNFSGQFRIGDQGLWNTGISYQRGDYTYLEKDGIKYYFVSITGHTADVFNTPPNRSYWGSDSCSKTIYGCNLRWLKNPYFRPVLWPTTREGWDRDGFIRRYQITGTGNPPGPNGGVDAPSNIRRLITPPWYKTGAQDGWPRRPDVHDPNSPYAHGIPKDISGEYLNGFLPFGGFPGVEKIS
jgi:lambda family phage minor tail protein L